MTLLASSNAPWCCLLTVPMSKETSAGGPPVTDRHAQMALIPSCFGPEALQVPQPRFGTMARVVTVATVAGGDGSNRSTTVHSAGDTTETEERKDASQLREGLELEQLTGVRRQCLAILAEYLHYMNSWNALQNSLAAGSRDGALGSELQMPRRTETLQTCPPAAMDVEGATLKVKNLPSKFTQEMLLSVLLSRGFKGQFDFLYIPYSPECSSNKGYAIVNFTQPEYAMQFYESFHCGSFDDPVRIPGRMLLVEPAPHQGYAANYYKAAVQWSGMPPMSRARLCPETQILHSKRACFEECDMPLEVTSPSPASTL
eukprot:s234_g27.t1